MSRIDEAREMFSRIEKAWTDGEKASLLTLTQVVGSAYRQPGAKMMMSEKGKMLGTLSGGCLEADLFGLAEKAMVEDKPRIVDYDLSENELWSLGIGCKGTVEIAIIPIQEDNMFWNAVQKAIALDRNISLAIELPSGLRVLFEEEKPIAGDFDKLPTEVVDQLLAGVESRTRAEVITVNERNFYIDTMRPNPHLIVCGAGHDAEPVVRLATDCGFRVTVLDPRSEFNNSTRFPTAEHIVVEPEDADPNKLTENWWIIMNHLQMRDEAALKLAIHSDPKYIGVLGPLSRTEEMLKNIDERMEDGPIHAPVGLDIGSETVEEVAVSIVSELLAKRSAKPGKPLHGKDKIHS